MYSEDLDSHPLIIPLGKGAYTIKYTPFRALVRSPMEVYFYRPPEVSEGENPRKLPEKQSWVLVEFSEVREYLEENGLADGPDLYDLVEHLLASKQ